MSILCQFPGTRRIRASGKPKEELKMLLLLRENGGWGSKQDGRFTDKPIVSMQSAVLYCRGREREAVSVLICLQPRRDKQDNSQGDGEESHASSVVHTIKVHGGAAAGETPPFAGLVVVSQLKFAFPRHDSFKVE